MTKRMLIDATHAEETRVVVVDKDQLCDFDFETSTKKQLKGNIYLAKVTRVEPSLQAAFVDYGGDRHGFLAFSEIHPDYYQIPQADREMLERMEREHAHETGDEGHGDHEGDSETVSDAQESGDGGSSSDEDDAPVADDDGGSADAGADEAEDEDIDDATAAARMEASRREASVTVDAEEETADVVDAQARMRARLIRSYKIQEVIKRRQILLVQVVKEERGNKGAALTTYLSLAGRYCVLMPNTPRGGGISRKIANANDRRRLKSITQEMEVPEGMGLIVRTAGQQRNKSEIKRDYDFLLRQWSDIRETTLESVAPALIYAEGDLIKRAVRDLYSRDIEEVLVEGEASYRVAKRLMQMMMPSRARNVKQYKDELPLFYRYKVEDQLDAMHSPTVYLPSGGSIVIHTTEALTAIDVNSGRSTRERHIDETALKTNLEAADEVARQLRLRDLAGLIVIDFIDMAEMRHQRQVERRFREALKIDRARLQVGKISMFGLLELSRQRLRASLQELSSQVCPTCSGLGVIRSTESCALQALRLVQEEGIKNEIAELSLTLPVDVGLYLLNNKRDILVQLEERYDIDVSVQVDAELHAPHMEVQSVKRTVDGEAVEEGESSASAPASTRGGERGDRGSDKGQASTTQNGEDEDDGRGRNKRRRRRRRRRGGSDQQDDSPTMAGEHRQAGDVDDDETAEPADDAGVGDSAQEEPEAKSGEREVRTRRRRRSRRQAEPAESAPGTDEQPPVSADAAIDVPVEEPGNEVPAGDAPSADGASAEDGEEDRPRRRRRRTRSRKADAAAGEDAGGNESPADPDPEAVAAHAAVIDEVVAVSEATMTEDSVGPVSPAEPSQLDESPAGEAQPDGVQGREVREETGRADETHVEPAADIAVESPEEPRPEEPRVDEFATSESVPAVEEAPVALVADATVEQPQASAGTDEGESPSAPASDIDESEDDGEVRRGWWSRWVR